MLCMDAQVDNGELARSELNRTAVSHALHGRRMMGTIQLSYDKVEERFEGPIPEGGGS